jgi:hypothetical protein
MYRPEVVAPAKKRIPASTIRPLSDKAWWDLVSAPLLQFLGQPRDWDGLRSWRGEHKMREGILINALAYLDISGRIAYDRHRKTWQLVSAQNPHSETP